jgi:hypothetical protein
VPSGVQSLPVFEGLGVKFPTCTGGSNGCAVNATAMGNFISGPPMTRLGLPGFGSFASHTVTFGPV